MTDVNLVNPVPEGAGRLTGFRMADRRAASRDGRLTVIDNGKPRARELMLLVADALKAFGHPCDVSVVRKRSASSIIDADLVAEIADSADAVLTGLGDCGACSACSLNDALRMELAGIPSTVIISDAFTSHIAALAAKLGAPGYPVAIVPHPVSSRDDRQLAQFATAVAAAVDKHLFGPAALRTSPVN